MGQYYKAVLKDVRSSKSINPRERFIDFLEDNDIHVTEQSYSDNDHYLECEFYSGLGEDFIFTISGNNNRELAKDLDEYYESFDPDTHAVEWFQSGNAPGGLRNLLDDAEQIDKTLRQLSDRADELFKDDSGDLIVLQSSYGGNKLMEHSYFNNYLCDSVSELIYNHPMRVSWVGDYTDEKYDGIHISEESICHTDNIPLIEEVFGVVAKKVSEIESFDYKDKFVINHTTGQYIDLNKYMEKSKDFEVGIYPISLLCCSNNGSGGSYYGINQNQCEKWNWCEISIEDELPEDKQLKEWDYYFTELDEVG